MDWTMFFQIWFMLSLAAVMFRQRMIYQERNAGYRLVLLFALIPIGLFVNLCSGIVAALVNYWRFAVDTYRGVEPGGEVR